MKIRHDTLIVDRFPEHQKLLNRDLWDRRIRWATRSAFFGAAFLVGMGLT